MNCLNKNGVVNTNLITTLSYNYFETMFIMYI